MKKPDMLVFFSDQHNASFAGFAGNNIVKTPNLDRIAAKGTTFDAAYTSCPLCVPARMSMLSGQLPSRTGIFLNSGALPEDQATFVHSLGAEGYETTLCGRMHFNGEDQRHGFTDRIMGEMTPLFWGRGGDKRKDLGPFVSTLAHRYIEVIGGGNSPVLEYDRAVIGAALEYLEGDYEKPQMLVVGTYAPHHTYVAPPDLYNYYLENADLPVTAVHGSNHAHPVGEINKRQLDQEVVLKARAAYKGMITNLDIQIGLVYDAWKSYLERTRREGIFVYISDHGDQIGERQLFGKTTFYEGSVRIPLIFEGTGIDSGKHVKEPVSIMDLGPTLCEISGAAIPPQQDGKSLYEHLSADGAASGRAVISEFIEVIAEKPVPGRMIRLGKWKYITYHGYESYDLLFDLEADPNELQNLAGTCDESLKELKNLAYSGWNMEHTVNNFKIRLEHHKILDKWGEAVAVEEKERWKIPEEALKLPVIY